MREWIRTYCKFCEKELEEYKYFPPNCDCEEYKQAKKDWQAEYKAEHQEPLTTEQYDEKYPQTYLGERIVTDKDGSHKLKLEARKYDDGEGLCVWMPFSKSDDDEESSAGLCFDFIYGDAVALFELLTEYLEKKQCKQ